MAIQVPDSFRAMPRWWDASDVEERWLTDLPRLVAARCRRWDLVVDGPPVHGSNALVVPVRRDGVAAVLRLAPPTDDVASLRGALSFWRGHGVVEVLDADVDDEVLLLERLDATSLVDQPLEHAVPEIGRIARRLATPVPDDVAGRVPHTAETVTVRTPELRDAWRQLGEPFEHAILVAAEDAAARILSGDRQIVAVNADLHFDQVLRSAAGEWRVVDPELHCGDAERTAANVLWHRVDEMDDDDVPHWFDVLIDSASLDPGLARAWAVWRITDYWLWGLSHGLTEDPRRCARLLGALGGGGAQ